KKCSPSKVSANPTTCILFSRLSARLTRSSAGFARRGSSWLRSGSSRKTPHRTRPRYARSCRGTSVAAPATRASSKACSLRRNATRAESRSAPADRASFSRLLERARDRLHRLFDVQHEELQLDVVRIAEHEYRTMRLIVDR